MPMRSCSGPPPDRKSTRLNSSHASISYAVFCLKKKSIRTKKKDSAGDFLRLSLAAERDPPHQLLGGGRRQLGGHLGFNVARGDFFDGAPTTGIYTLSLHDALPI